MGLDKKRKNKVKNLYNDILMAQGIWNISIGCWMLSVLLGKYKLASLIGTVISFAGGYMVTIDHYFGKAIHDLY